MTEQQYVDATNLAKARVALQVLRDILITDEGSTVDFKLAGAKTSVAYIADVFSRSVNIVNQGDSK